MIENLKSKFLLFPAVAGTVAAASSVVAFAVEETGGTPAASFPTISITTDMLMPVVEAVTSNLSVILPVGLGLLGLMASVRIIPRVLSRFVS